MFNFHSDPGHGWLEVDWTDLKKVGLNPSDFSRFSYRKGNTFFLEEDCDAPKFIAAWTAKGWDFATQSVDSNYADSYIRSLPSIAA